MVKEGELVDIKCKPAQSGSLLIWFRVLPKNMEFIGSFSPSGLPKSPTASLDSSYGFSKISNGILSLKKFKKSTDSGIYSCAFLKGTQLMFGDVTRLVGGEFCFLYLV